MMLTCTKCGTHPKEDTNVPRTQVNKLMDATCRTCGGITRHRIGLPPQQFEMELSRPTKRKKS